MGLEFGMTDPNAECPVSLDLLGQLYRAAPASVADMLRDIPQDRRARLAFFCYGRAHLRELALTIAMTCDAARLAQLAGTLGQVLAQQCRRDVRDFGNGLTAHGAAHPRAKVTLAALQA